MPSPRQQGDRLKILVIDDDPAIPTALGLRLGRHFEVVGTTDPAQAVTSARAERPDLIMCDINMPGMTGDEVVYMLSSDPATGTIPVIYLTSLLARRQTAELGETFGGHPGISKSAPTADLLALISRVLG